MMKYILTYPLESFLLLNLYLLVAFGVHGLHNRVRQKRG
jgi:hypothetical protein